MAEIRHELLNDIKHIITDDISIKRCLETLKPCQFKNKIGKEFIDSLENLYDFTHDYDDRREQISECFDDLLLLLMKLSEEYMRSLQLMETWKSHLNE